MAYQLREFPSMAINLLSDPYQAIPYFPSIIKYRKHVLHVLADTLLLNCCLIIFVE